MRIGYLTTDPQSTCSWWRIYGPISQMARIDPAIQLSARGGASGWLTAATSDVIWANGFWTDPLLAALHECGEVGCPVIGDIDDEMFEVYDGHPFTDAAVPRVYELLDQSIRSLDACTASTMRLASSLETRYGKAVAVIPNAMLPDLPWNDLPREKKIIWRGSQWHRRNMQAVAGQIVDILTEHKDWKLVVFGSIRPWEITERVPREQVTYMPQLPIHSLFSWYSHACNAAVWIAPLIDHPFNQAKSHISFLEATQSGATYVGMDYAGPANVPVDPHNIVVTDNIGQLGLAHLAKNEAVFGDALRLAIKEFEDGKSRERVVKARSWVNDRNRSDHWMSRRAELMAMVARMRRGSKHTTVRA